MFQMLAACFGLAFATLHLLTSALRHLMRARARI